MLMPGRTYSATNSYRYGFNGKENDNEVKGEGNSLDFGSRIYDSRIGKWLSVDPLQTKYADLTPYNFTANNPINFLDYNGRDTIRFIKTITSSDRLSTRLDGVTIPPSAQETFSVQVKVASGDDVFFYEVYTSHLNSSKQLTVAPPVIKQFYPNTSGRNSVSSGITYTHVGLLGDQADNDSRALAKLAPQPLIDYLVAKNPALYKRIATGQAFYALEQGVERAQNLLTTLTIVIDGFPGLLRSPGAITAEANFAQTTFSAKFSNAGSFAGKTVDEIATALKNGSMSVSDVPIQYIMRDGKQLILNTRSAAALTKAGIDRSKWLGVDVTGNADAETRLTDQLTRNKLTNSGTSTTTQSGTKIQITAGGVKNN